MMQIEKKECENAVLVLTEAKKVIKNNDSLKLKELSNRVTHSSCFYQDSGLITTAVLIYTLSKLIEREDYKKIKSWLSVIKKINSIFDSAISALQENNQELFSQYMQKAMEALESSSINIKPYIENVMRNAAINKANKLHEHGLSLEKTASLLGITRWELADYIGQKRTNDFVLDKTMNTKKRAEMALEFFN